MNDVTIMMKICIVYALDIRQNIHSYLTLKLGRGFCGITISSHLHCRWATCNMHQEIQRNVLIRRLWCW